MDPKTVWDEIRALVGEIVNFLSNRLKSLASRKFALVVFGLGLATGLFLQGRLSETGWVSVAVWLTCAYVLGNAFQKIAGVSFFRK